MKKINDIYIQKSLSKLNKVFIPPMFIFFILGTTVFIFGFFSELFPNYIYSFDIDKYRIIAKIISLIIFIIFSILMPIIIYRNNVMSNLSKVKWRVNKDIVDEKNYVLSENEFGDTIYYLKFKDTDYYALVDYTTYLNANIKDEYYLIIDINNKEEVSPDIGSYKYILLKSQNVLKIYSLKEYEYIGNKME